MEEVPLTSMGSQPVKGDGKYMTSCPAYLSSFLFTDTFWAWHAGVIKNRLMPCTAQQMHAKLVPAVNPSALAFMKQPGICKLSLVTAIIST